MVRLPFWAKHERPPDTLDVLLTASQAGDAGARDRLLQSYLPFVDRVVHSACGRAVSRTEDEFQIALLAMNEAIDGYRSERGSFIGFAETVMRRRLIDSFRSSKRRREIPWTAFDEEDEDGSVRNAIETQTALAAYQEQEAATARAREIARYAQELAEYGIAFAELPEITPKHSDAKDHAIAVARLIASDAMLIESFRKKRSLPLKMLDGRVPVSRKTLERQRTYIVAIVVLLLGEYELLQAFVGKGAER